MKNKVIGLVINKQLINYFENLRQAIMSKENLETGN